MGRSCYLAIPYMEWLNGMTVCISLSCRMLSGSQVVRWLIADCIGKNCLPGELHDGWLQFTINLCKSHFLLDKGNTFMNK